MIKKIISLIVSCLVLVLGNAAYGSEYPNYGIWNDQLTPTEALGRFQWLEKCYNGLLIETWERMYGATIPRSQAEKISDLKNHWLYTQNGLRADAQYPTFGDFKHENPSQWQAGLSSQQGCKTIPQGYSMIGLLTSIDIRTYCPISSNGSRNLSIKSVRLGGYTNSSGATNYSKFSGHIMPVNRGDTLRLVLTEAQFHPRLKGTWHAFVDWNRNGILNDSDEMVISNIVAEADEVSINLVIPQDADTGYTRLRVTDDYAGGSDNPCANIRYGEVEDHTLKIN